MKKYLLIFLFSSVVFIARCDKGIEPNPLPESNGTTGFAGTITFSGNWPDSVKLTLLVVFKNKLQSAQDFGSPNLSYAIGPIPYGATIYNYNSVDNSYSSLSTLDAGSYNYVVVAQSTKETISLDRKDWFVAGVYCVNGNQSQPATLIIEKGKMTQNVNINVDFNNPPPQPPGG
ncbi:hypothetical protein ABRY23_14260 [Melioribacteraceae bacterium 4301-Me]|uniref:hypothetical protein n=1 Tax=Pyranulibacter aquaticus TaxID=3163344 RepID=UPI0035955CD1